MTAVVGSLCSGYGGLDLGLSLALGGDVRTAWHVENDEHAAAILAHHYPGVPNHGDLTAVDWTQVEAVDWLTAGFPCQDLSHAGRRAGMRPGTRSGLWFHVAYAIGQLRPRHVLLENVRGLLSGRADRDLGPDGADLEAANPGAVRALGVVLGDLADLGFDARWVCVRASDAGAPHGRARVFIVATDTESDPRRLSYRDGLPAGLGRSDARPTAPDAYRKRSDRGGLHGSGQRRWPQPTDGSVTATDPDDAGRGEHRRPVAARPEIPAAQRGSDAATDAVVQRRRGTSGQLGGLGTEGREPQDRPRCGCLSWGKYAPAVHRWELVLGRPAPAPTEPGLKGLPRLSRWADEWLMGLPDGWVTAVPGIPRNAQLRAFGNGCVPQQVTLALHLLGVTASERVVA